jgi:hypothetical protein
LLFCRPRRRQPCPPPSLPFFRHRERHNRFVVFSTSRCRSWHRLGVVRAVARICGRPAIFLLFPVSLDRFLRLSSLLQAVEGIRSSTTRPLQSSRRRAPSRRAAVESGLPFFPSFAFASFPLSLHFQHLSHSSKRTNTTMRSLSRSSCTRLFPSSFLPSSSSAPLLLLTNSPLRRQSTRGGFSAVDTACLVLSAAPVRPLQTSARREGQLKPFVLADIGEGITECEIVKWCVWLASLPTRYQRRG